MRDVFKLPIFHRSVEFFFILDALGKQGCAGRFQQIRGESQQVLQWGQCSGAQYVSRRYGYSINPFIQDRDVQIEFPPYGIEKQTLPRIAFDQSDRPS